MKISILICSIPNRVETFLPKLIKELERQTQEKDVEYLFLGDNKRRTVGEKRNGLLKIANGDYVVFIDDDDWINEDYVDTLLSGVETGADVVCFKVMCSVNGEKGKEVIYNAKFRRDKDLPKSYERIPNHIMCVKKEHALATGFIHKSFAEDADYAKRLKPLLKSQCIIDEILYFYNFYNKISETQ